MLEKVSVVVPIYNSEKYIEKCIRSIISQTYINLEILLVNDGSTDSSLKICEKMAEKDERLVVISQKNSGVAAARRTGVRQATGEYIVFIDSDDYVDPEYVYEFAKIMQEVTDIVISGFCLNKEKYLNNVEVGKYNININCPIISNMIYAEDNVSRGIMTCICGKMFKTSIAKKIIENIDTRVYYGEDGEFIYKYLLDCKSAYVTDYCGYHYTSNSTSITHTVHEDFLININRLYLSLKSAFEDSEYKDVLMPQLEKWTFEHIRVSCCFMGFSISPIRFILPYVKEIVDKKLVVYGAGDVGRDYVRQIKKECIGTLQLWVDRDYKNKRTYFNQKICSPSDMRKANFDFVIIAISKKELITEVREEIKRMGIDEKKIISKEPIRVDEFYA